MLYSVKNVWIKILPRNDEGTSGISLFSEFPTKFLAYFRSSFYANWDLDHLDQIKPYNHKSQDTYTNVNNDGSILEQATIETKESKPDQN